MSMTTDPDEVFYKGKVLRATPDTAPLDEWHFDMFCDVLEKLNNAPAEMYYANGSLVRSLVGYMSRYGNLCLGKV